MPTISDIRERVGSVSGYGGYILLLAVYYAAADGVKALGPLPSGPSVALVSGLVISPLLLGGVLAGLWERRLGRATGGVRGFLRAAGTYYFRILFIYLISWIVSLGLSVAVAAALGRPASPDAVAKVEACVLLPLQPVLLFWYAGAVADRRGPGGGLLCALRVLVSSGPGLVAALVWSVIRSADFASEFLLPEEAFLATAGLRAGIVAFATVCACAFALSFFGTAGVPPSGGESGAGPQGAAPGGTGGGAPAAGRTVPPWLSFIPVVHLAVLASGVGALRRERRFAPRAVLACCLGGFFTLLYLLVAAGLAVNRSVPRQDVGYGFIGEADPALKPQVLLLEQGAFGEARRQLERGRGGGGERSWAYLCASAVARLEDGDVPGSLADFGAAGALKPDRSEFEYHYGRALLADKRPDEAAERFRRAAGGRPTLPDAERMLALARNTYAAPFGVTAVWFGLILLVLLPLHEAAHAFAAWKLGDDTARSQGRMTLNPLRHIDPVGSLLLPALLIARRSDFVIGWAKPVPVDASKFANPAKDQMSVSFAGPASNLVVSMACLLLLGFLGLTLRLAWPGTVSLNLAAPSAAVSIAGPPFARGFAVVAAFLKELLYTSLALGCFNLLPVPPLDGSWILWGALPEKGRAAFDKLRPYGFVLFVLLALSPVFGYVLSIPVGLAWGLLQVCLGSMGLG